MSYLVLARKYRPQTFADLVGQEQLSRTLQNALVSGRLAHAYLFSGPRGVGKTTAARLLAMSLSCLAEDIKNRPCGQCENCLEIQSGQAVDVIEVDGASNRGINEIRDLRETVKYLPAKSRYKVYIIDEVHALTKEAFNALLKTLEEPPPHVVFIFATTEANKVLPTILSRCQRYDFRRIGLDDIVSRLAQIAEMENIEAESKALEILARQADGGLRDSLSLMDQAIAACGENLLAEDVERALGLIDQSLVKAMVIETLTGKPAEALQYLDDAYIRGYDFKELGRKILEFVRGLTIIKVDRQNARLLNLSEADEEEIHELAAPHSLETLHRHFDAWLNFQKDLNYSSHPRWLLESQVIRLANLAPLLSVGELSERLMKLLGQNPPPPRPTQTHRREATPLKKNSEKQEHYLKETDLAVAKTITNSELNKIVSDDTEASSEGGPKNWGSFYASLANELESWAKERLHDAKVPVFNDERIELVFRPGAEMASFMKKQLCEQIQSSFKKQYGVRPQIHIEIPVDKRFDESFLEGRLEEIKKTPEIQALMKVVAGNFIEFLPGEIDIDTDEEDLDEEISTLNEELDTDIE